MSLSPHQLADILVRQGLHHRGAGRRDHAGGEAHPHPPRARRSAYEQKALAYELIERPQASPTSRPAAPLGEIEIAQAIAADAKLPHVRIDTLALDADLIESKISRPFAKRHRMIPLEMSNGRLRVACANPYDIEGIDSFKRIAGRDLELVVASEPDILKALTEFYGLRHSVKRAERDLTGGIDLGNLEQLVRMKSEAEIESSDQHIVNAVEFMLQHAFDTRASRHPHRAQARRQPASASASTACCTTSRRMPKLVHAGRDLAHQDHVAPRHRREAPAAGRPRQDRRAAAARSSCASRPCRSPSARRW